MLLNECKNEIQTSNITKLPIIKKKKRKQRNRIIYFSENKTFPPD